MLTARAEARIDAPADRVLAVIRDFERHHPHILPPAFTDFRVVEGGIGAGTVTSFTTNLGGRRVPGRTVVSEPEPGVVREQVEGRDMVTTFRVVPDGVGAQVSIDTHWTPVRGVQGLLERLLVPRMLRDIYRQELRLLTDYVTRLDPAAV